ncbi:MAG: hypothetical protein ACRDJO_07245 [Actinomycetota bacterium]
MPAAYWLEDVIHDGLPRRIDQVRDGTLMTGLLEAVPFGWEQQGRGGVVGQGDGGPINSCVKNTGSRPNHVNRAKRVNPILVPGVRTGRSCSAETTLRPGGPLETADRAL